MSYLSWEDTWHWGGTSRVTWRVGERLTGSQQSSLLLGCHDLLSSCWRKSKTFALNKTRNPHISATTAARSSVLWCSSERDTYHQWRPGSRWGRTLRRFHSRCSAAHLSRAVWPWHHRLLWGWCCWSYLGKAQEKSISANIWNQSIRCVRAWGTYPECRLLRKESQKQAGGQRAGGRFCKLPGSWTHFPNWRPG